MPFEFNFVAKILDFIFGFQYYGNRTLKTVISAYLFFFFGTRKNEFADKHTKYYITTKLGLFQILVSFIFLPIKGKGDREERRGKNA